MKGTSQKGITLVALIITIIVLLIIAVVAISVVKDSKIIDYAENAANNTRAARILESLEVWKNGSKINKYLKENNDQNSTIEQLLNKLQGENLITEEERIIIEKCGEIKIGDKNIVFGETILYEKEGLILYCDGINNTNFGHDSQAIIWRDLSGNNNDLNLVDINFDNNSAILNKTSEQKIYSENNMEIVTVEVVCKPIYKDNDWSYLGQFNRDSKRCIAFQFSQNAMSTGHNKIRYPIDLQNTSSISVDYSQERVFINGMESVASIQSETWQYSQSYPFIVGDYRNPVLNPYNFNGHIYCIRVYNKQLTEEQIQHNYEIDKQRFNL